MSSSDRIVEPSLRTLFGLFPPGDDIGSYSWGMVAEIVDVRSFKLGPRARLHSVDEVRIVAEMSPAELSQWIAERAEGALA